MVNPRFDVTALPSPCYVVDEARLIDNLTLLRDTAHRAGCKILLAQKAFSMFSVYPLIGRYLDGTAASGLFEARLGHDEMGGETHVFSAAFRPDEMDDLLSLCNYIVFNSFSQWQKYRPKVLAAGVRAGLRINPEHSTQNHALYDPCAPFSRLGIPRAAFKDQSLEGVSGLHFHTLCEQGADALAETLDAVKRDFDPILRQMEWVNFGGGHHITRSGYDVGRLVGMIRDFRHDYGLAVYLEPGEAIALDAGYLCCTVLDITENGMPLAILDTSAACHMPDVLEMPYRPPLLNAGLPGEKAITYRLGGPTCLAGDVIGDYSFDHPLRVGDRLIFGDMAIYTMVKNNTFNGMNLPAIAVAGVDGEVRVVRQFGYEEFKGRLS